MDGEPPGEVWYIEFRWANTEAAGRDARFFGSQAEAEDFLHFCYVSQYKPGDVLSPTAIWFLNRPEGWVRYDYAVKSYLAVAQTIAEPGEDAMVRERGFASLTDPPPPPPDASSPVEPGVPPPGVILPDAYLPPSEGA